MDIESGQKDSHESLKSDLTVDCDCSRLFCCKSNCHKVKVLSLITHVLNTVMISIILFKELFGR